MAHYGHITCPVCNTNLETIEKLETCPVCKAYIADKIDQSQHEGMTTATVEGEGLHPIADVIQDVY